MAEVQIHSQSHPVRDAGAVHRRHVKKIDEWRTGVTAGLVAVQTDLVVVGVPHGLLKGRPRDRDGRDREWLSVTTGFRVEVEKTEGEEGRSRDKGEDAPSLCRGKRGGN